MQTLSKRMGVWAGVVALILCVPLVAMQFTSDVDWALNDFVIMGILLFGSALIYELLSRTTSNTQYRVFIGLAVAIVLFLTWAELAVGLFGTPWAGS